MIGRTFAQTGHCLLWIKTKTGRLFATATEFGGAVSGSFASKMLPASLLSAEGKRPGWFALPTVKMNAACSITTFKRCGSNALALRILTPGSFLMNLYISQD